MFFFSILFYKQGPPTFEFEFGTIKKMLISNGGRLDLQTVILCSDCMLIASWLACEVKKETLKSPREM